MNKFLLGALLAGVATSAFAADLPTRKEAPPPPMVYAAPMFTWTGFYVGANGGIDFVDGNGAFGSSSGGMVGGTVGYNYQMGQLVIGAEGDWDWAGVTHTQHTAIGDYHMHQDQVMTARARLGYAMDRALLFVTAGYAGAELNGHYLPNNTWDNKWRNGAAIGGGVEYAITNNISAKAEYLYLPMASATYFPGTPFQTHSSLNESLVRIGLNYKF
jgi:outer membrane immunogenic protein